jgi:hypothetical protein
MEVQAYRSARHGPALGFVVRILIGLLVGWIGGPLWMLFIVQVSFELYRSYRRNPSEYPALNLGAAVLGWLIGNSL